MKPDPSAAERAASHAVRVALMRRDMERMLDALTFAANVIKERRVWTPTCQAVIQGALDDMRRKYP